MPVPVTIPVASFEVSIAYVRPVISLWLDRATIVQAMFDFFEPSLLNVDDIEAITTGKSSEQGFKFKLTRANISFFFGPAGCKFTKEDASWKDEDTLKILTATLAILVRHAGVTLGKHSTSLALHVQPKNDVHFMNLLRPFLFPSIAALETVPSDAIASVVRWPGRRITLDGSAVLANALFLNLERDFDPNVPLEEMKATIINDETALLKLLDVEEVSA